MFDAAFGASGQPGVTYLIALRDGGLGDTSVVDITTGNPVPIPPATGIDPVTGNTITRPSVEIVTGGGSASAVLHHEDSLALPYLSDPLARGAVLFGLPGLAPDQAALIDANGTLTVTQTPLGTSTGLPAADVSALGSMTQVGFGDGWPQRLPFRLRVAEAPSPAPAPPQWDATARVLTVFLEKSQQCTVRLASFLLPGDIAVLGQWSWLVSSLPAQTLDPMALDLATAGALWALTPPRMITLVHAVQHPLKAPVISSMSTLRGPGDTLIYLAGDRVHGASSAKIDLMASSAGRPPIRPENPRRKPSASSATSDEVPIPLPEDHRHRLPAETTRARSPPTTPRGHAATWSCPLAAARRSARNRMATAAQGKEGRGGGGHPPPLPYTSRQDFSDTKHRSIRYFAVATSRFRNTFHHSGPRLPERSPSAESRRPSRSPAARRPAAPRVVGCLPDDKLDPPRRSVRHPCPPRRRPPHPARPSVVLLRRWRAAGDRSRPACQLPARRQVASLRFALGQRSHLAQPLGARTLGSTVRLPPVRRWPDARRTRQDRRPAHRRSGRLRSQVRRLPPTVVRRHPDEPRPELPAAGTAGRGALSAELPAWPGTLARGGHRPRSAASRSHRHDDAGPGQRRAASRPGRRTRVQRHILARSARASPARSGRPGSNPFPR